MSNIIPNENLKMRPLENMCDDYESHESKRITEKCPLFDWFVNFNSEAAKKKILPLLLISKSPTKQKILQIEISAIFLAKKIKIRSRFNLLKCSSYK